LAIDDLRARCHGGLFCLSLMTFHSQPNAEKTFDTDYTDFADSKLPPDYGLKAGSLENRAGAKDREKTFPLQRPAPLCVSAFILIRENLCNPRKSFAFFRSTGWRLFHPGISKSLINHKSYIVNPNGRHRDQP
jgi:hypothetical protein